MEIALKKSPDIQATNYGLEAANDLYKSARAALGPKIFLSLSRDSNTQAIAGFEGSPYHSGSNMAMLTLTIPFSLGSYHSMKAQAKAKEAAELDRTAALDDARHNLQSAYIQLETQTRLEEVYRQNLEDSQKIIDGIIKNISSNDPHPPSIQYALDQINSLEQAYMSWQSTLANIVTLKFSVQQVDGTLFEANTYN